MISTKNKQDIFNWFKHTLCYKKFISMDCTQKASTNDFYIIKGNLYVLAQNENLSEEERLNCYNMGVIIDKLIHPEKNVKNTRRNPYV